MTDLMNDIEYSDLGVQTKILFQKEGSRIILLAFKRGQSLAPHSSKQELFLTILEGSCDLTVERESKIFLAGSVIHIKPEAVHALKAVTNFKALLVKC